MENVNIKIMNDKIKNLYINNLINYHDICELLNPIYENYDGNFEINDHDVFECINDNLRDCFDDSINDITRGIITLYKNDDCTNKSFIDNEMPFDDYISMCNDFMNNLYHNKNMYDNEYVYKFKCNYEMINWLNKMYEHCGGITIILKSKIDYLKIDVMRNDTGEIIYNA